jgi:AcrR family transcriptional regulator
MIAEAMDKTAPRQDETRERILDVSRERFTRYGYGKTTMAEIAKDCDMSAANLYRYFESKQDIAAGLACHCLAEDEAKLRAVVNRADLDSKAKFELFVLETFRHVYEQWTKQPHVNEIVQTVTRERRDIVDQHQTRKQRLLIEMIEEGNARGEFDVADVKTTASSILLAIIVFDVPFLMHLFDKAQWERRAKGVAQLILNGICKC